MVTVEHLYEAFKRAQEEEPIFLYHYSEVDRVVMPVFEFAPDYSIKTSDVIRLTKILNEVIHQSKLPKIKSKTSDLAKEWFKVSRAHYRSIDKSILAGPNDEKRFYEQIKTQEDAEALRNAIINYKDYLKKENWRLPKTNLGIFLGTKSSGYFWHQFKDENYQSTSGTKPVEQEGLF